VITEIEVDTMYIGHDGTKRYVDDFDGEEVVYYVMTDGPGQTPIGYCSAKTFLAWALSEVDETNDLSA
jgi:hypothetical protein